MTNRTEKVFHGWLELNEAERRALADEIAAYNRAKLVERRRIERNSVTKMETGPLGQPCPCCGR